MPRVIASSVLEDDQITATYTPDGSSSQLLTGASAPIEQQVVNLPTIGVDADVPLAWQGQAGDFLFSCMDGGSSPRRPTCTSPWRQTECQARA